MECRILLLERHMARILELVLNGRRRVDAVPDNLLLLDYLPLHRLRQNHRSGEIRGRAKRGGRGAVNEIVPARSIGAYVPMVDGPDKVSGHAKYTADLIAPGLLAGRIFRSPYSHGEILEV